ncbi:Mpv17/PMP22 family protein [Skeletonema marinoi]|uniref:Mpv17/PMP22 family protein n=1 Tax=Skeletonema marinoi TaxID=267567 RepID=A0AAD8XSF2_9STRA|nr:Mpv17/PMP22 family protein [Skeletonema marinoi]
MVEWKLAVTAAVLTIFSSTTPSCQAHPFLPSNIGSTINTFYKENPFKGAFLTCSIKGCSADMVAQFIASKREHREEEDRRMQELEDHPFHTMVKKATRGGELSSELEGRHKFNIDWSRSLVFILYGGLYQGMAQEFIYNRVLPIFGTGTDMKTVARKVAVDMGFISPLICIPTAYIIKGFLIGNTFVQSLANYVDDVVNKGLVFKNWSIFVPVQCITFSIIPEHFRVSFVACISFFWMIILSSILSG